MISTYPKFIFGRKEQGIAILLISIILVILSTLMMVASASFSLLQTKTTANISRREQAFEAAEAGLEFGFNYLNQNSTTILANPSSGFITPYSDSNTTNISLANGSKFSIVFTNPIANNYKLILIKSTGTSSDGTSTRVVSQQVGRAPALPFAPTTTVTAKGQIDVQDNATITNTTTNNNLLSGGYSYFHNNGQSVYSTGVSNLSVTGPDVKQNVASISSLSANDFFISFFGRPPATMQSLASPYYTCANASQSKDLCSLANGVTNSIIYVNNQDVCQGGPIITTSYCTIGTPSSPVILIIQGTLQYCASLLVYGFVYGDIQSCGYMLQFALGGARASSGHPIISGNDYYIYQSNVLTALQKMYAGWGKVPGTWKDF